MTGIAARFEVLSEMRRKHLAQLVVNQADPLKDKSGSASSSLAGMLRFLSVSEYVLNKNVSEFRSMLVKAAALNNQLFERFDKGETISPSYVSMMSYKALLNVLASGDENLAKEFAAKMGGRSYLEKEYDRAFDIDFGYALKSILLSDFTSAGQWVDALDAACKDSENTDFVGYAKVLRAILSANHADANAGLAQVVAGHKRQCVGKGLFKDTEDELLCVWGVAVANLARMRGVKVQPIEPLIPGDLLV